MNNKCRERMCKEGGGGAVGVVGFCVLLHDDQSYFVNNITVVEGADGERVLTWSGLNAHSVLEREVRDIRLITAMSGGVEPTIVCSQCGREMKISKDQVGTTDCEVVRNS